MADTDKVKSVISKRKALNQSCKQKNNLLHKDTKPKSRERESLKCKKPVHAVKGESAENFQTIPLLDECYSRELHINSVSTPVSKTLTSVVKPCEVRLTRINTPVSRTLTSVVKPCEVRLTRINTPVSRTLASVVKPCEVRLIRMKKTSLAQKVNLPSKHKRKPSKKKASQVSHIIAVTPADGTGRSLRSSVSSRSCSEKSLVNFVTHQKQKHSKCKKKCKRKSLVTSSNQEFPITSTPIHRNTTSRYQPNEISKEGSNVSTMTSKSSQIISLQSPNESSKSSSKYSLRSRSSSKSISNSVENLITEKVKPKKQPETLQSLTPIVKKTITKQVSSISYQKKTSKHNQKSSISSSISDSTPSTKKKTSDDKSSTKYHKNLHAMRKNVSDIPVINLTLPGIPLQPRKVKSDNFKVPGKNTLKRKRYTIEALKKLDENYEDDIYEPQKFENFKDLLLCSPDSNSSIAMSTPKMAFQVTPVIRHRTPKFKDFFNATAYAKSRKVAEECMYRKQKKKNAPIEIPVEPEKKKLEYSAIISEACRIQQSIETMTEGSDEENSYFSFID